MQKLTRKVCSMDRMRFERQDLPVGEDRIPLLVASEGEEPKAVFMSYDAFLELAATLYTAVEALREAGIDPSALAGDDDDELDADDVDEFQSWDEAWSGRHEEQRPPLRLVVGG